MSQETRKTEEGQRGILDLQTDSLVTVNVSDPSTGVQKAERVVTTSYLAGKFIEFFFGLQPKSKRLVVTGFVMYFIVLGLSAFLGYFLVESTQSQLVLTSWTPPWPTVTCPAIWINSHEFAVNGSIIPCEDSYWNSIAMDPDKSLGFFMLPVYPSSAGRCIPTIGNLTSPVGVTPPVSSFRWWQTRASNDIAFFPDPSCSPQNISFLFGGLDCNMIILDVGPAPTAIRSLCPQANLSASDVVESISTFISSNIAYSCTLTIDPAFIAKTCLQDNLDDGEPLPNILPFAKSDVFVTFDQVYQLYPSLVTALSVNMQNSVLFSTFISNALSLSNCLDAASADNYSLPFSSSSSDFYLNPFCLSTTSRFCNRLCHLTHTIRPDFINPKLFSHFPLFGSNPLECIPICSSFNQSYLAFVLDRIQFDSNFESVIQWTQQAITRCLGSQADPLVGVNPTFFLQSSISCFSEEMVPISPTTLALNRFVNILSWIGVFQLTIATCLLTFYISRRLYLLQHP